MLILVGLLIIKEMYRKGVSIRATTRQTGRESKSIWQMVTTSLVAAPKSWKKQVCKIDSYVPYLKSSVCIYFLNVCARCHYVSLKVILVNQTHICADDGKCARIQMETMNNQLCIAITNQFIGVSKNFDCIDWLCKPIYSKQWVF